MERTERLFDILGEIDEDLIAAATPKPAAVSVGRTGMRKKWLPAVACLCLAAVIGVTAWQIPRIARTDDPSKTTYPPAETVMVPGQHSALEAGSLLFAQTTAFLFDNFTVGDVTYSCNNTNKKISPLMIGESLGTTVAKANNVSSEDTRPITYYRILGVSEQCAVAVLFEGEEDIYVYCSESYCPDTLATLLADTSFAQYLTADEITVTRAENEKLHTSVYRADTDFVVQSLLTPLKDIPLTNVHHTSYSTFPAVDPEQIRIRGQMEVFGYSYLDITVSQNGYLVVPLFGSRYVFAIDDASLQSFLAALGRHDLTPQTTVEDIRPSYNHHHDTDGSSNGADRFPEISVGGLNYICGTVRYGIDADRVGERLGETRAADTLLTPTVTYYRILGISEECGIAVRFPDDPTYYSYHNLSYQPATLGDLIADLGLASYLRIGDPTVTYREAAVTQTAIFRNTDAAPLWQTILRDSDAACVSVSDTEEPVGEIRLAIPIRLPIFCGSQEFTLWVTEDGYLHTDLFETFYYDMLFSFRLTEGLTAQYIVELLAQYPDYDLIVTDPSKVPIPVGQTPQTMSPHLQYNSLEIDGITYVTAEKTAAASALSEQMGEASAIYGDTNSGMICRTPVAYCTVKGYAARQAVAVRFTEQGDGNWYLYINPDYADDTLNDFLQSYQIRENGTFTDFRATVYGIDTGDSTIARTGYANDPLDIMFPGVDPARAWEILFSDPHAPRTPTVNNWDFWRNHYSTLRVTLLCPTLDDGEVEVTLDKNGYLCFSLQNNLCYVYEIGKARAAAFLDYILTSCIDTHEIRNGAIVLQSGETYMEAITRQLRQRFGLNEWE